MEKLEFTKRRNIIKHCPCGKSNKDGKFVPFRGYEDNGYCHSCGDVFLPEIKKDYYEQFRNSKKVVSTFPNTKKKETGNERIAYLPFKLVERSMKNYERNNFYLWLKSLFGETLALDLCDRFCIGTSSKYPGATIFHQIDVQANLRQSKVMQYNFQTGKRQELFTNCGALQTARKILGDDANIKACYFNECDLTLFPKKPVAICESEKTAIIASVFFPQFTWIASGGKHGVKMEESTVLKGRRVILFPDGNAYKEWKRLKIPGANTTVSNLLTEGKEDIVDYLIVRDQETGFALVNGYPAIWDYKKIEIR